MKKLLSVALLIVVSTLCAAGEKDKAEVEFLNSKPASSKLPFSEAVRVGKTLYLSGQIGFDQTAGKLAVGGFKAETHQTLTNIKNTLEKFGASTEDVFKCLVMLTDINDFAEFNQIYTQYFTAPYPARSAFAVKELALGSLVEVECVAQLP